MTTAAAIAVQTPTNRLGFILGFPLWSVAYAPCRPGKRTSWANDRFLPGTVNSLTSLRPKSTLTGCCAVEEPDIQSRSFPAVRLLNHLIGAQQQRLRDRQPEHPRSLQVDE